MQVNPENELDYFASYYICKSLYQEGIITFEQFDRMNRANEKYIGDTLHQKTFTPTQLPFRNKKNRGEMDQYYVCNSHEAVLDKDIFYAVQEMIELNQKKNAEKSAVKKHKFTGKLFCCDCGWAYKKHIQNGVVYWACSKNGTAGQRCSTHPMSEEIIERTFCNLYNKLRQYNRIS